MITATADIAAATAANAAAPVPTTLFEITFSAAPRVDREAGVIRGVKILGPSSRNGRVYTPRALKQAADIYEGVDVNIDHPDLGRPESERKFADGFGYLTRVVLKDDGVYGDLVYLKSHALAEQVCEAAERMPHQFGLSHNAEGIVAARDGQTIVEEIISVRSVDIVRHPATSRGLFEAEGQAAPEAALPGDTAARRSTPSESGGSAAVIARLQEQVARLSAECEARRLLEAAGIRADEARLKAVIAMNNAQERAALIATWTNATSLRPRSSQPLREARYKRDLPTSARGFARAIK